MKRLMAIAFAAFALLGAEGRDTAIYNGKLTSAMNANGMAITNAPTPVRDGDLVNKSYVDGIAGVTPGTVTNIANARIDAKVAPWAMSGQPKPEGISPSAVTNIAESAAVTNAGAVASAKAYADGKFAPAVAGGYLPLSAGSSHKINSQLYFNYWKSGGFVLPSNIPGENLLELNGEMASFEFYGHEYDSGFSPFSLNFMTPYYRERYSVELTPRVTYDVEIGGDILDAFVFKRRRYMNSYESVLMPDNSPVVTSNMLNGVLTPALAQKADRAVPSASGNFAALTAQGNLADSGKKASDFATPQIVTNIVTNVVSQAYIRQRLGVYLYVGPDNGIYVHVE